MTSNHIYNRLFPLFNNYDYKLKNTYVFMWESDFFAISSSRYCIEVEVKVSKADFKADYKKILWNGITKHDNILNPEYKFKPHKFCFACPEGMIDRKEINPLYGLIYIKDYNARYIQNPKFLHKDDLFNNPKFLKNLMNKYYYRNLELLKVLE